MYQEILDILSVEDKPVYESPSPKSFNDLETKKQSWTKEQDDKLFEAVTIYGAQSWSMIAKHIPGKTGKQCSSRWKSCLNPDYKKGDWKQEEDQIILELVQSVGTKWSKIALELDQRSPLDTKNRFHALELKAKEKRKRSGTLKIAESYDLVKVTPTSLSCTVSTDNTFQMNHFLKKNRTENIKLPCPPLNASISSAQIKSESTNVTTLEGLVLKQVPGHPYLFYDENHEMMHQMFDQVQQNGQHQSSNGIFASTHSHISSNYPGFL